MMTAPADTNAFVTRGGRSLHFTPMGFGTSPIGNFMRVLTEDECDATLACTWNSGIRYYDTAPYYGFGLAETRLGRLLQSKPRDEFIVSTKVGRVLDPCEPGEVNSKHYLGTPQLRFSFDYSYDGVMRSYEDSLKRLGLDRIDILFVHDLCAFTHGTREAAEARIQELLQLGGWRALSELRSSGAIDAIGAGVNEWEPCARLLELADPDLFLLAGRYTLLEQQPHDTLFPECIKRNVGIVIGGPFNSGILVGKDTFNYEAAPADVVARVRRIQSVCATHGVALHRAALQFVLAHPAVVSVIPGGQTVEETAMNVAALDQSIPREFWADLKSTGLLDAKVPTP